ncbi:hypothetical protein [Actinomadura keratinilytica]|uniref:hypothetical protein n=1 Tax=Actinomadura keratinilytica TaxID=547461 RepID=UPI00360AE845
MRPPHRGRPSQFGSRPSAQTPSSTTCTEILPDETKESAAAFWACAWAFSTADVAHMRARAYRTAAH